MTSAGTAFTLSAWDPTILQDPPREESGYYTHTHFLIILFPRLKHYAVLIVVIY